jgi:hypothetical protein
MPILEERARVGGTEKLLALRTALDTEQSQGANHITEIVLDAYHSLEHGVFGRVMRPCL